MAYFKNLLRHSGVSSNVTQNFGHYHELMEIVTTGYVFTLAMKELHLQHTSDVLTEPLEERHMILTATANKVVEFLFKKPDIVAVMRSRDHSGGNEYAFCTCKEHIGGEMVECGYPKCDQGMWFHLSYKGMEMGDVPLDPILWYCSALYQERACWTTDSPSYDIDHKLNYSKELMWHGLMALCRRDAIRENDRPRMILHWKCDLFWFFEKGHPKYFIFGHRLLTDVGKALPEDLAFQLLWNRTVNVRGGKGKNVAADLHMEHLNKRYKESIKSAGGNLTNQTIVRHSQMLGLQDELSSLFKINLAATEVHASSRKVPNRKKT